TAARMAFGIYGCPAENTRVTLSKQNATEKAIYNLFGVMGNLPVVIDEMTGTTGSVVSNIIYNHSHGQPPARSTQSGEMSIVGFPWSNIAIFTGNNSLAGLITAVKPSADAEIARMVEFRCVNKHR